MPLVYRAVSEAEFEQIVRTGTFEVVPFGCEGKDFANTISGARRFGHAMHGRRDFARNHWRPYCGTIGCRAASSQMIERV